VEEIIDVDDNNNNNNNKEARNWTRTM